VSEARNIGLSKANGHYVYFVDSDDRITNNCLFELYNDIQETKCDVAVCNYDIENQNIILNHENRIFVFDDRIRLSKEKKISIQSSDIFKKPESSQGNFLTRFAPMGHFLFQRNIIEDNKIRFTYGSKFGEDTEFFTKVIFHSQFITFDKEVLSHCVQNNLSVTRRKNYSDSELLNLVFQYVGTFFRLKKYLYNHKAPNIFVNYISDTIIPETIINIFKRLIIEGYPKDKLVYILKNKEIKKAIHKYKVSFKNKINTKRSIKIIIFRLLIKIFYLIFVRGSKR
ncbi:MAG: glycosyltransferase, partial [Candidatus Micrarchaeaceae archaeon]